MNEKYKEYLRSEVWRQKALHLKNQKNYCCEICGNHILMEVVYILLLATRPSRLVPEFARFTETVLDLEGDKDRLIEVHHRTYQRIGNELPTDLACLCRPCHVMVTENADRFGLEASWQITVNQVELLVKKIQNKPDGKVEFTHIWSRAPIRVQDMTWEEFREWNENPDGFSGPPVLHE